MFQDGVFVSRETIQSHPALRIELIRAMGLVANAEPPPAVTENAEQPVASSEGPAASETPLPENVAHDDENFVQFSRGEARKLLAGCSEKVKKALAAMVAGDKPFFLRSDVAKALGADEGDDLRGVWAGLTRRTRTVTGDDAAYLISWREVGDEWGGDLTPETYRSLRLVLQLD